VNGALLSFCLQFHPLFDHRSRAFHSRAQAVCPQPSSVDTNWKWTKSIFLMHRSVALLSGLASRSFSYRSESSHIIFGAWCPDALVLLRPLLRSENLLLG
jgi:hypothetical protein